MTPTLWQEGRLSGRDVALAAAAATLLVVASDLVLTGRLSFFFDVTLVPLCLLAALAVRPRDFFWVAVLPPLLVLGTTVVLALSAHGAIADAGDGPVQSVVTGLATHGAATLACQALALAVLGVRRRVLAMPALVPPAVPMPAPVDRQDDPVLADGEPVTTPQEEMAPAEAQSNGDGSPAPTLRISG